MKLYRNVGGSGLPVHRSIQSVDYETIMT